MEKRKSGWVPPFIGGAVTAVIALMALGETGGNHLRGVIADREADYSAYSQQCEASLERAVEALQLAEEAYARNDAR